MSNTARLNIAIEVDDRGSVKIRQLGRTVDETGRKGEKSFRQMSRTLGEFRDRAARTVKTLALFGSATILGGLYALNRAMTSFVALANDQEEAENRLQGVLRATGHAAGFNLAQLKEMASAMQSVTTVGDEVILSGMSILATFKNVRGEAFERTTRVALDMARVMGTDLNSAMLQIGKAMNDPAKNLSMLSRAGVTFTQTQVDMVKQMVATGDTMGAQEIILRELESEFGGAAEMARGNFKGAMVAAGNALGDLKEEIGFTITKNRDFIEIAGKLENIFNHWIEAVRRGRETTEGLDGSLDDLLQRLDKFGQGFFEKLPGKINAMIDAAAEGAKRLDDEALPVIEGLWTNMKAIIDGYNALDPAVKDLGLVMAIIAGKKGMAALAAVSVAANAGHKLSDALLKVLGVEKQQVAETGSLTGLWERYDHWVGRAVQSLQRWYAGSPRVQEFTGVFVNQERAIEDTGAAVSDLAADVDALASYYEATGEVVGQVGKKTKESVKDACEATKKQVKCVQHAAWEMQQFAAEGRALGKDMWLSYAEGAEAANDRAQKAVKASNDAINADLEDVMAKNDDLWGFHATKVERLQQDMVNDLGRIMDGYISDILHGEIDSIGEMFQALFDSILDMFIRLVSQMAANSLVEAIFGQGASGGPTLSSLGGIASSISSALGGPSIGSLASSAASSLGLAGGATTVAPYAAGGTYATLGGGTAAIATGGTGAVGGAATFGFPQAGSVSATGAGAPSTAAGGGLGGSGMVTAGAYAAIAAIAGKIAMGVLHAGDHATPSSALTMLSPLAGHGYDEENILGKIADDQTTLSHAIDKMYANMLEGANNLADGWGDQIRALTDELAKDMNPAGVEQFLEALAGIDVSAGQATAALELANQAASGNAGAMDQLTTALMSMGMSSETASAATAALMEAERKHGAVVNETVGEWRRSIDKLSATRLDLSATAHLNVEVSGAAHDRASVSSSISTHHSSTWNHGFGSEDTGWGDNITQGFWWESHAVGGIFTRPTLLAGLDGLHQVAEAGVPELITPIPGGPRAFAEMADGIKALLARGSDSRPIVVQVNIAGSRVGEVLIPMVDRHIDARQRRGVEGRVAYAAG